MADTPLSQAAYDRLQAELEDLQTRGRVDIAGTIQRARELGDLSENADYHAAREDQGRMEARIRQLQAILDSAVIVEKTGEDGDRVAAGSVVTLRAPGDDDLERFLVGSIEERRDDLTVVSPSSPLGSALLGKAVGERVSYQAPGGTLEFEIVDVDA